MVPEKQDELAHGMRGGIPRNRMEQIHSALPYSLPLCEVLPQLADPLAGAFVPVREMKARVRLSDGWHMLNQARMALVEAEACTIFYEEIQQDHTEALYHCRYYLDDAALRLCVSCEHLAQSVIHRWSLKIQKTGRATGAKSSPAVSRDGSLILTLKAAQQSNSAQVSTRVARILRKLRSSKAWKGCVKYRHDWVHGLLPATAGLSSSFSFQTVSAGEMFPPEVLKYLGAEKDRKYYRMALGVGASIDVLRDIIREAYCDLFQAYGEFARLLAEEGSGSNGKKGERHGGS